MSSTSIVVKCLESLRCVCLAVCTHPCLHAHLRGCVHAYIHTRISMYTCMCVPGCVYTSMFERSHAFNVCGWLRVHTHVCTHAYTHAPSHVYMHTHTHTSTHTHKHTSSCGGSLWDADPQNPCLTRSLWTHTHTHKICTQIFVLLWWVAAGLQDPCLARSLWTHTHKYAHKYSSYCGGLLQVCRIHVWPDHCGHTHTQICTQTFVLLWWVAAGLQDPCLVRSPWAHTHPHTHTHKYAHKHSSYCGGLLQVYRIHVWPDHRGHAHHARRVCGHILCSWAPVCQV